MAYTADRSDGITRQIKAVLRRLGHCELEELISGCPNFTWNQIFSEIDRISRTGEVLLERGKLGTYLVTLPLYSSAANPEGPAT
jgi:hypothetical protein